MTIIHDRALIFIFLAGIWNRKLTGLAIASNFPLGRTLARFDGRFVETSSYLLTDRCSATAPVRAGTLLTEISKRDERTESLATSLGSSHCHSVGLSYLSLVSRQRLELEGGAGALLSSLARCLPDSS